MKKKDTQRVVPLDSCEWLLGTHLAFGSDLLVPFSGSQNLRRGFMHIHLSRCGLPAS